MQHASNMTLENTWTDFVPFPSPLKRGYLYAPYGAGVYELKNIKTNELIYVGESDHTACRMSSLIPGPLGTGGRNNLKLRKYIFEHIEDVHYRTLACENKPIANQIQVEMISHNKYLYN
jgi:hypothetical protein